LVVLSLDVPFLAFLSVETLRDTVALQDVAYEYVYTSLARPLTRSLENDINCSLASAQLPGSVLRYIKPDK